MPVNDLCGADYRGAAFGTLLMLDQRNPGKSFFASEICSANRNLSGRDLPAADMAIALEQMAEDGRVERVGAAYRLPELER